MSAATGISSANRLVIKVGSALLCDAHGQPRRDWLAGLAADIDQLRKKNIEVIVVTSGAIALGKPRLGLTGVLRLDEKQAASAAGQVLLSQVWQGAFDPFGIQVAQILLTLDDTENRRRYLNARNTFRTLLDVQALPLVNENDTIATSEIRYGDNDRLAAHAAQLCEADLLVILSDVDGLYTSDPRVDPSAQLMPLVKKITPQIEALATGPNVQAGMGSGGMASKIAAAKIAGRNGCATLIAQGRRDHPLRALQEGAPATLIEPSRSPENARRQWIAGRLQPSGIINLDAGAVEAVRHGNSLLPAGVISASGDFARGDAVSLCDPAGRPVAQGLAAWSAGEIKKIAGLKSDMIEKKIGYRRRPAIVEKNDLVLMEQEKNDS
ncbi:glutamate 5-kinase [Parvularcula sp. IMCC14364]|uniref:glutamate 5-kinase n=1 Tax=Parvularcula sp. IMCC14364 TaxID=3067902 RepID=UPI0027423C88|nr:glutamate 5-kinase [Parvularcula sp. IMCC14364]